MTIKQFIRTLLFILAELVLSPAQAMTALVAGDLLILVKSEPSGADTIYRYAVVNNSQGKMMNFSIGVIPVEDGPPQANDNSYGSLTRLPTGTTWGMAPAMSLEYPGMPDPREGDEIPIASSGMVTVPATPAGWRAEIGGIRLPGVELAAADAEYSITWYAPKPVYGGPVNVTGADAGQRLDGFSVRVPKNSTTGPGAVGSAANYTQGQFEATLWFGTSWINTTEQKRRGQIIPTPSALVSFSSSIPGSETNGLYQINTTAATPAATITANIVPLGIGVEPTITLESIACYGECGPAGVYTPTAGISGAAFGTDDRTFQVQGYVANDYLVHSRYFLVTYVATSVHGTNRIYTGILLNVTGIGTVPPPGVPSSITVPSTTTTGTYTVSWGAATGYVTHYELQEGTESTFTCYMPPCISWCIQVCKLAPVVYSGPNLSYIVGANSTCVGEAGCVKFKGTFYYRVRACNSNTGICSAYRTGSNATVVNIP